MRDKEEVMKDEASRISAYASMALSVLTQLRQPKSNTEARLFRRIRRALDAGIEGSKDKGDEKGMDFSISNQDWSQVRSLLMDVYEGRLQVGNQFGGNAPGSFNAGFGELDEIAEDKVRELKEVEKKDEKEKDGK